MQLALAAHQQFACAPVDIVELDRDDLGRAQPEPRHEQQHRIVARAMPRVARAPSEHQPRPHRATGAAAASPPAPSRLGTLNARLVAVVPPRANRYWKKLRRCVATVLSR